MATSRKENHSNEVVSINFDYDRDDADELSEGEEDIIRELTTTMKKSKQIVAATTDQLLKEHDDNDHHGDDDELSEDALSEDALSEGEEEIIDELLICSETTATLLSVIMKSSQSSLAAPNNKKKKVLEEQQDDDEIELITIKTTTDPNKPPAPNFPSFCPFIPGDHVYQWYKVAGIPLYHHHGIVMKAYWDDVENLWMLCISDFSNISLHEKASTSSGGSTMFSNPFNSNKAAPGGWRTYVSPVTGWIKVIYRATFWELVKNPSPGTSTGNECDPSVLVLSRVLFLQEYSVTVLDMPYHWAYNNCETAAVWCKTGKWCTLQALCAAVATTEITAVTTAPVAVLVATQPYAIPIVAAFGVLAIGLPAVIMHQTKKKWNKTTDMLNDTYNLGVGVFCSSMINNEMIKKKVIKL